MAQWKNLELISVKRKKKCPSFRKVERDQKQEKKRTNWLMALIMKRGKRRREAEDGGNGKEHSTNKRASNSVCS